MDHLTDEQWEQFERDGYTFLGKLLDDEQLAALQKRMDDIMMGEADVDYDRMMMQLDSDTGNYADVGEQTRGHKGPTLNYRKIEDLEWDPRFLEYMQRPLFREICARAYDEDTPVGCFRAMFVNKPASGGTVLPWHQDRWTFLDRDPQVTIWTALDPATRENGCVRIIPGSHRELVNPDQLSGFLTEEQAEQHCSDSEKAVDIVLEAGEVCLLHNWSLHSSDVNRSEQSRRAFSACYMDARTQNTDGRPTEYSVVLGEGALSVSDTGKVEAPAGLGAS